MLTLIAAILVTTVTPSALAWDSDQMEVFDLVEEMNNINFYQFLDVPEVSCIVIYIRIILLTKTDIVYLHQIFYVLRLVPMVLRFVLFTAKTLGQNLYCTLSAIDTSLVRR